MPPMPKHHTKGVFLTNLEAFVNGTAADARSLLTDLRNGQNIAQLAVYREAPLATGSAPANAEQKVRTRHMERDWFGWDSTRWSEPGFVGSIPGGATALTGTANSSTGWWRNWRGTPEPVLRCGLIRSLEVAMRIGHWCPAHNTGSPSVVASSQQLVLPVSYHWVCGVSRFEVFVSWNPQQVTTVIVTPGFPYNLIEYEPDEAVDLDAWATGRDVGTIYVGQDENLADGDTTVTAMNDGVITHHLSTAEGGSGVWP